MLKLNLKNTIQSLFQRRKVGVSLNTVTDEFEGTLGATVVGRNIAPGITWEQTINSNTPTPIIGEVAPSGETINAAISNRVSGGVNLSLSGLDESNITTTANVVYRGGGDRARVFICLTDRGSNDWDAYMATISQNSNYVQLSRRVGATTTVLQEVSTPINEYTEYELTLSNDNGQIQVTLNGSLVIDIDDSANELASGTTGFSFINGSTGSNALSISSFSYSIASVVSQNPQNPLSSFFVAPQVQDGDDLQIAVRLTDGYSSTESARMIVYEGSANDAFNLTHAQVMAGQDHTGTSLPASQAISGINVNFDGSESDVTLPLEARFGNTIFALVLEDFTSGGTNGNGVFIQEIPRFYGPTLAVVFDQMYNRSSGNGSTASKFLLDTVPLDRVDAGDRLIAFFSRNGGGAISDATIEFNSVETPMTFVTEGSNSAGAGRRISTFIHTFTEDGTFGQNIRCWQEGGGTTQTNLTAQFMVVKNSNATINYSVYDRPTTMTDSNITQDNNIVVGVTAGHRDPHIDPPGMVYTNMERLYSSTINTAGCSMAIASEVPTNIPFTTDLTINSGSSTNRSGVLVTVQEGV